VAGGADQTPWRSAASKAGSRRSAASISNSAISATARELVPGRLHTGMPRARAASRSMVLTPMPIFWISRNRGAAAMTAAVQGFRTCQSTSASVMARAKPASSSSGQTVTSSPGSAASRAARAGPAA